MRFQVNDIVAAAPGWSPGVFVITAIHPTRPKSPYDGVSLRNSNTYRLSDESLADKRIGVADAGWNTVTVQVPSLDGGDGVVSVDHSVLRGRQRARREIAMMQHPGRNYSQMELDDIKRWEKLASLNPGDKFQCRVRGKMDTMTFRHITERGYKFVFVAENGNGTCYKYPLRVVVV